MNEKVGTMTYEQAEAKVRELNGRGWALSLTQSLGRIVDPEVTAAFTYFRMGASAGSFCADTIPEAIELAAHAAEECEAVWTPTRQRRLFWNGSIS